MIAINDLKALADKLQVKAELKLKESKSKEGVESIGASGEAIGLQTSVIELWKFINEQQLKANN